MDAKVIEAMRAMLVCEWGEGVSCVFCNASDDESHLANCPVRVLREHLATMDEPKGEPVVAEFALAQNETGDHDVASVVSAENLTGDPWGEAKDVAQDRLSEWAGTDGVRFFRVTIPLPRPAEPIVIEGEVSDG